MASHNPVSAMNGCAMRNVAVLALGGAGGEVPNARGYTISPCFGPANHAHHSTIYSRVSLRHDTAMSHGIGQVHVGLPRALRVRLVQCFRTVPVW